MTIVVSPMVTAVANSSTVPNWWLSDPTDPTTAMILHVSPGTFDDTSTDRQNIIKLLDRPDPVVLSDVVELPSISLSLVFLDNLNYQSFKTLRQLQRVLLLTAPYPIGHWYVRLGDNEDAKMNLATMRGRATGTNIVRNIALTAQAVAAPTL